MVPLLLGASKFLGVASALAPMAPAAAGAYAANKGLNIIEDNIGLIVVGAVTAIALVYALK
jgi:hypothetical protein